MKQFQITALCFFLFGCLLLGSCQKELTCEWCTGTNKPPVARAGDDQSVLLPLDSVLLNGDASTDPDGRIISYSWQNINGPSLVTLTNPGQSRTVAGDLVAGTYSFELTVTDDGGLLARDTVLVLVESLTANRAPITCAGADHTITLPMSMADLDGSCSTDPDGNIVLYQWTKINGPASASFINANAVQTQVSNLVEGSFHFQLKVTDAGGLFSMDTVQVIVNRPADSSLVDVYVCGDDNGRAAYWKNGQLVRLPATGNSVATAITVVGNDVYVAGKEGDFYQHGNNRAKYWKNGQEFWLTGPTGAGATSIAINGSDVYVAGWEIIGTNKVARYWKNGQGVTLSNGTSVMGATGIVVVGGDVYVAGDEDGVAKYWKNGQAVSLTDGSREAYANAIAVSGGDVYVAGSEYNGTAQVAKYWKNGQAVTLTNGAGVEAVANAITVVGTDVYVAGWDMDFLGRVGGTWTTAMYWKNGQGVALTHGSTYAYPKSIAVFGNDIYVAGHELVGNSLLVKYWKNGQATILSPASSGLATGIVVVRR